MLRLLLISLFFLNSVAYGQLGCNPTVTTAPPMYYSNTTTAITSDGHCYLCGPNTVVYDSVATICWVAFANANCTITANTPCPGGRYFFLKSGSVLNLGSPPASTEIYFESGAVINNPFSIPVTTVLCTNLSWSGVSCTTGILKNSKDKDLINIFPNPASNKIKMTTAGNDKYLDVVVTNQFGEVVLDRKYCVLDADDLDIRSLANGLYSVEVKTATRQQTKKLIVIR